eukprot:TRINITY_DN3471_c0_g1_i7.p1 TRINITY_DN3471_c0_g1~~TRINITY_DN3471_c0_g1_i7.p1  ORF type:complete len:335 (+),score=51.64 TRINITY_DN3471_c0_g1_i7:133-1005(+)
MLLTSKGPVAHAADADQKINQGKKWSAKDLEALGKALQRVATQDPMITPDMLGTILGRVGLGLPGIHQTLTSMPNHAWRISVSALLEWLSGQAGQSAKSAAGNSGLEMEWIMNPKSPSFAEKFFHACESGGGWEACKPFCTPNTVQDYTEWMKSIAVVAMPGCSYELNSQSFDPKTSTAVFVGTFRGTHTGHLDGLPAPTHKSMETHYVYSMHVNSEGKVDKITKVWHSAWAAAQAGWTLTPPMPDIVAAESFFHACESGKGWVECKMPRLMRRLSHSKASTRFRITQSG